MTLLAEVADIQTGPFGSQLHKKDYVASGRPIVTVEHLGKRAFTRQNLPFVSEFDAERLKKYQMKHGDVIFSRVGSVDRCSYAEKRNEGWLFSGRCLRIRPKKSIDPEFLYYYLSSKAIKGFVRNIAVGATMPSINTTLMGEIPIPAISLDRQRAIACIMSSLDIKLQANAKLNGYLAELAQTIYNDWFRDFGHWGGRMPSHWETGVLGDYVTVKRGGSPRPIQEYLSDEGLRWLKIADVSGISGPYILEIKEHIKEEGLRKTVHLEPGSLVLSNSATPGIPKILSIDTCIHDGWLYFPQSQFTNEWLYCYFLNVRQELVRMANGSVFQNLKTDIVKNFEVIRPDDETLASFQEMVAPLFNLMESCQKENKQLADLRDTLLPKLMSGEIDVSKVDFTQLNSHLEERRPSPLQLRDCR